MMTSQHSGDPHEPLPRVVRLRRGELGTRGVDHRDRQGVLCVCRSQRTRATSPTEPTASGSGAHALLGTSPSPLSSVTATRRTPSGGNHQGRATPQWSARRGAIPATPSTPGPTPEPDQRRRVARRVAASSSAGPGSLPSSGWLSDFGGSLLEMRRAVGPDPVWISVPRGRSAVDWLRREVPAVAHIAGVDPDREPALLALLGGLLPDAGECDTGGSLVPVERLLAGPHASSVPSADVPRPVLDRRARAINRTASSGSTSPSPVLIGVTPRHRA